MIDVGGPSLLRGAAKNFAHVAPVCRPEQYDPLLAELRESGLSPETRRALAAEAFAVTAAYDAAIARWFAEDQFFPDQLTLTFRKIADLAYGENPHQTAAYYEEVGSRKHLLSRVNQLGGRELSYNNLADLEGARRIMREFSEPTAVIVKHANPAGVAVAETIEEAYLRAHAADPVSAFGCVLLLNRPVDAALAEQIADPVRRGRARTRVRRAGARDAAGEAGAAHPPRPGAPQRHPERARLQAGRRRHARPGARQRDRRAGGDAGRHRRARASAQWEDAPLCLARLQARRAPTRSCSRRACRRSGSAPGR